MTESNPTTRESVAHLVLTARTEAEIVEAERQVQEWIRDHPQDKDYLLFAGESLRMVKTA